MDDRVSATSVPESLLGLLFQATRELVMNARKHAAPSTIEIHLTASDRQLEIIVRDDGSGFAPDTIEDRSQNDGGGFGLFNIRQRLGRLGGSLLMASKPGAGSELRIVVPLPEPVYNQANSG